MTTVKAKAADQTDWHIADIKAAVEKAGWSFRRLSVHHGLAPNTLVIALRKPAPAQERRIAAAIGIPPQVIWPSRYTSDGLPVDRIRRGADHPKVKAKQRKHKTAIRPNGISAPTENGRTLSPNTSSIKQREASDAAG